MKHLTIIIIGLLLVVACGQSYEETKRLTREQRREAMRKDSAAFKVAVLPTLDCLPFYVAEQEGWLDTLNGGVRLKHYMAQMDCDTAFYRGRVEGMVTDLVRAKMLEKRGMKIRYWATGTYWQLVTNRNSRVRQLKQLDDKMVAMTRFSATDLLTDRVVDSVKLDADHVFKVQVNDLNVRMQMLYNNEIDALWLPEPQATAARQQKHFVVADSRSMGVQLGAIAFNDKEMRRSARAHQLSLLLKAYNMACDTINKYGLGRYRALIAKRCHVKKEVVDSLSASIRYQHARGPRQEDVTSAEKWMGGTR